MHNIGDIIKVNGQKFEIDGYRDSIGTERTVRRYTAKLVANPAIRSVMPELNHFLDEAGR